MSQFSRSNAKGREPIEFLLDGERVEACLGDTVLTAVLLHRRRLRPFEFSDAFRSGFCLMGACQDCWVHVTEGERVRACTTLVVDGMRVRTKAGKNSA